MTRTIPVMTRVAPETKEKLQALARSTKRSEGYLANEAIESYVAANEWQVSLIERRLAAARAGEPTVPHEEVERWLAAKGTDRPLPMPKAETSAMRKPERKNPRKSS
jgi:predicted transcriptional regulator